MTKAFINILSNLSHSINILYIVQNLVQNSLQNFMTSDYESKRHCYSTTDTCETCGYALKRRKDTIHFQCGHAYHKECVNEDPLLCVICLMNRTDQFSYYLNTLNPRYPRIRRLNDLFTQFEQKKFEMS